MGLSLRFFSTCQISVVLAGVLRMPCRQPIGLVRVTRPTEEPDRQVNVTPGGTASDVRK
jgi:hypothetical protein